MYERNWSYIKKEKFNNILEVKVRKFEYGFQEVVEDIKNCRKTEGKNISTLISQSESMENIKKSLEKVMLSHRIL